MTQNPFLMTAFDRVAEDRYGTRRVVGCRRRTAKQCRMARLNGHTLVTMPEFHALYEAAQREAERIEYETHNARVLRDCPGAEDLQDA